MKRAEIHCGKQVKLSNKRRICRTLIQAGSATKLALSRQTGLSVATCGSILNELVETGEVFVYGLEKSKGGRPAKSYAYNENFRLGLCIHLDTIGGRERAGCYVVNLRGEIVTAQEERYNRITPETVVDMIHGIHMRYPAICTVVIGLPGSVEGSSLIQQCTLHALEGCALGDYIRSRLALTVCIENDMNLRALGFYAEQGEQAEHSIAIIEFPEDSCAGAGFVLNGLVWNGSSNFAGEVSYLPFSQPGNADGRQAKTEEEIVTYIANVLLSVCSIMNPHAIVLSGSMVDQARMERAAMRCSQVLPHEHIPKLVFHEDRLADYRHGLIWRVMQCWEALDDEQIAEIG